MSDPIEIHKFEIGDLITVNWSFYDDGNTCGVFKFYRLGRITDIVDGYYVTDILDGDDEEFMKYSVETMLQHPDCYKWHNGYLKEYKWNHGHLKGEGVIDYILPPQVYAKAIEIKMDDKKEAIERKLYRNFSDLYRISGKETPFEIKKAEFQFMAKTYELLFEREEIEKYWELKRLVMSWDNHTEPSVREERYKKIKELQSHVYNILVETDKWEYNRWFKHSHI